MIGQRRIKVNGVLAELGTKVTDDDIITVDGKQLNEKPETVYIAFNKPVGIICTTDTNIKDNILDYMNYPSRIFHIGRLDKPSEGLIFMTNDGDIVNKILRAGNNHEKEYIVTVDKPLTGDFIRKMSEGVNILDTVTQKCFVKMESKYVFRIILKQGLNRQIRRMCEVLGYEVIKLKRIRIMNVTLDGIRYGEWRYLTSEEIEEIKRMVETSSKTEEASLLGMDD
jgi:23S rRNA pseudouridine2604 synthase